MEPIEQAYKNFIPDTKSVTSEQDLSSIIFSNVGINVKQSHIHGIGVFADKPFKKDEIVEKFPIVPLSFRTNYQGDARVLDYSAIRFCECEECKRHGYTIFMRFGYGALYNHQDNNNATLYIDYRKYYGTCTAFKDIEQGEEITINYGDQYIFREGKNSIKE